MFTGLHGAAVQRGREGWAPRVGAQRSPPGPTIRAVVTVGHQEPHEILLRRLVFSAAPALKTLG